MEMTLILFNEYTAYTIERETKKWWIHLDLYRNETDEKEVHKKFK